VPEPCPIANRTRFFNKVFVEVDINGVWGLVCADGFDRNQGQVICRGLHRQFFHSYSTSQANYRGRRYHGTMRCRGTERKPEDCVFQYTPVSSCPSGEVAVQCASELPDMVADAKELENSLRATGAIEQMPLSSLRCAIEEGCLASDAASVILTNPYQLRKLLRFDSLVNNFGKADFRPFLSSSEWEYHDCHRHYHSHESFASYELYDRFGNEASEGQKASFCLEDSSCPRGTETYKCYRGVQGIAVGCGDLYARSIDCQWLDITHVRDGSYVLRIHVNAAQKPEESEYRNNIVNCPITISGTTLTVTSCSIDG
jgi:lysyl oxidase-like protein 2/3/4